MKYAEFICDTCGYSDEYLLKEVVDNLPKCPHCNKEMRRIYSLGTKSGGLTPI